MSVRGALALFLVAAVALSCTMEVSTVTPAPSVASVTAPERSLGAAEAPVTMEEWSDFQ